LTDYNLNENGTTPSFTDLAEIKPENVLEAAVQYTKMGVFVTPCKGKKPVLAGWPQQRLNVEDLPQHFGNGQNVAWILGEPSGWLVDVDLDVPEARKISDLFLPKTLRGGREGTPDAHYWYRSPGAKTKRWQDVDGTMLVEQRSDGCQTLVPPSVHPNGERYLWDPNGVLELAEVDLDQLEERCTKLATATVVARHVPAGGRHEYAMAVIGFLMRHLEREATLEIVWAAWHAADAAGTDALRDLDGIAEDTERRLAEGENAFGGPTLQEMVPGLPKLLDRWWGRDNNVAQ